MASEISTNIFHSLILCIFCFFYVEKCIFRLGVLAPDGYCRPFDIDATGYTRSEAVCLVFLQKAKDAKRIYSTVLYSKTNCDGALLDLSSSNKI